MSQEIVYISKFEHKISLRWIQSFQWLVYENTFATIELQNDFRSIVFSPFIFKCYALNKRHEFNNLYKCCVNKLKNWFEFLAYFMSRKSLLQWKKLVYWQQIKTFLQLYWFTGQVFFKWDFCVNFPFPLLHTNLCVYANVWVNNIVMHKKVKLIWSWQNVKNAVLSTKGLCFLTTKIFFSS